MKNLGQAKNPILRQIKNFQDPGTSESTQCVPDKAFARSRLIGINNRDYCGIFPLHQ